MTTSNGNELASPSAVDGQSAVGEAPGVTHAVIDEAAQVSEQAACASVDGFKHETEMAQDRLKMGLNTVTQSFQRMTDQFTQMLGSNGSESEEQSRRASQNLQAVTQASTVLMRGAREVLQELIGLVQDRMVRRVEGLNQMAGCRSVRAFVAAQSELMRDNLQLAIDTNRRIAALSVRIADEAASAIQAQADNRMDHARRVA